MSVPYLTRSKHVEGEGRTNDTRKDVDMLNLHLHIYYNFRNAQWPNGYQLKCSVPAKYKHPSSSRSKQYVEGGERSYIYMKNRAHVDE